MRPSTLHPGYVFNFNGASFDPDGVVEMKTIQIDAHNAELTRAEVALWKTKPAAFTAYYRVPNVTRGAMNSIIAISTRDAVVTTWTGEDLGRIVSARIYRHNFGGRFIALQVEGNNGARYWGRASWDGGSVVRLRRMGKGGN